MQLIFNVQYHEGENFSDSSFHLIFESELHMNGTVI